MKRFLPFVIIIFGLGAAVALAMYFSHSSESGTVASAPPQPSASAESGPRPGAQPPHEKGPENAVVTLEEFGDFECSACARFHPIWKSLEPKYGQRVRITFRHFPLALQHKRALAAAYAAEAAGLQGKFWAMHDKLFENRETWVKATDLESVLSTYAKELGLDLDRFNEDKSGDAVRHRVNQDFQRGRSLKVKATPTLYLNGVEIPYNDLKTIENFEQLLDQALKESSAKSG
jgi:protein-disulfide isomerase